MFRFRMPQDPSLSWSLTDDDLYNRFLRHAPLQTLCYNCRSFGHYASSCPLRAGSQGRELSSPFRAPHRTDGRADVSSPPVIPASAVLSTCTVSAQADTPPLSARDGIDSPGLFCPLPCGIISPVNVDCLEHFLSHHPNRPLVSFVLRGFRAGFDIGFFGNISSVRPNNLLLARSCPSEVYKAIFKEVSRDHTSGPFVSPPVVPFHCSPLGAVPKKDGSYRLILDLSSPRGCSVNEGISWEQYSVRYSSFDDAVDMVRQLGPSSWLDIKHAFRLCPVRSSQWGLLGYCWQGQFFLDTRLPFGSWSSPFLFNNFADLLLWILVAVGGITYIVHYLDDFSVGPATSICYLGIEIDSKAQVVRLPADKFTELLAALHLWRRKKKCTKWELLSIIGSLSFASKVVKPGRMFLRRLINLSTTVSDLNHHISLNTESRADINCWCDFLPSWNGVCYIQADPISSVSISLFTDASGFGLGAVYGTYWLSVPWPEPYKSFHINILELFAIVAAVVTWGHEWRDQQILFFTDNSAITHVWRTGTSVDRIIMKLVRYLFLFSARLNLNILMQHIPGHTNLLADALSRLQVHCFRQLVPGAHLHPSSIPPELWHILT